VSINVTEARLALVDALSLHDAVQTYELVPLHPTVPCIIVYPPDTIDYMVTKAGDLAVFGVLVLVGPRDPTSQEVLEGFMSGAGDLSVRQAIYADRTLGGKVSNSRVLNMTSGAYTVSTGADDSVIGAEFRIEVIA